MFCSDIRMLSFGLNDLVISNNCDYNDNAIIERNLNCIISIIIYKEHATKLYDNVKIIIQTINNKYKFVYPLAWSSLIIQVTRKI